MVLSLTEYGKAKRNTTSTIFSQQIIGIKLLRAVTYGQESNISNRFKLKIHNNLPLKICCKILQM